MFRRLRAAAGLSLGDWRTIFRAWRLLWVVSRSLRRGDSLPQLQQRLSSLPRLGEPVPPGRLARLIRAAALLHPLPTACLARAVCLQALLRAQSTAAQLQVGVHREAGELSAHAWVEVDGAAVAEPQDVADRFLPLRAHGASDG